MSSSCQTFSIEGAITNYLQTIRMNPYIVQVPTDKQALFLLHDHIFELLFGGSAGGAKSSALLMGALQYVHVPGYAALLLRQTYKDLSLPGALMDRAHDWLEGKAHWDDKKKTWKFPSGATLTFGYLENPRDHYQYQGSEFQYIGFDELTQFRENQYKYLRSRVRKPVGLQVPLRIRAASNPGDRGHDWVRARFIDSMTRDAEVKFIPSSLDDNPYLDRDEYKKSLSGLDPVTREQLLNGDWDIRPEGQMFKREWFNIVDTYPADVKTVRYWDKAATAGGGDWTAGAHVGVKDGKTYIIDMVHEQLSSAGNQAVIKQTGAIDTKKVPIVIEQEPGASGKDVIDVYARYVLPGYIFRGHKPTGSKAERASPLAAACEMGNVFIVKGAWNKAFIDELVVFPTEGAHDDQVDAAAGAFNYLFINAPARVYVSSSR